MTRFWITLDQAVQFVADCFVAMSGGEVFVPKIPSTRVARSRRSDRARRLPIRYTGIRPGEKLHESLITPEESRHTSDHGWCYIVEPEHAFWTRHDAPTAHPWKRGSCTAATPTSSGSTSPSCASCLRRCRRPPAGGPDPVVIFDSPPAIAGGTPIRERPLPYGRHQLEESDVAAVVDALRSGTLTGGAAIADFEHALATRCTVTHAVAVANGSVALDLAVPLSASDRATR